MDTNTQPTQPPPQLENFTPLENKAATLNSNKSLSPLLIGALALLILAIGGGLVWYVYTQTANTQQVANPPTIPTPTAIASPTPSPTPSAVSEEERDLNNVEISTPSSDFTEVQKDLNSL